MVILMGKGSIEAKYGLIGLKGLMAASNIGYEHYYSLPYLDNYTLFQTNYVKIAY